MNTNPKGLFDRSTLGRSTPTVEVAAEPSRIRFFAKMLGYGRSIHTDAESAREAGYPAIVAPPSFFVVLEAQANEMLEARGELSAVQMVRADSRHLLHGEECHDYTGVILAGDTLTVATTITDFYDKKGGALEFVTLHSTLTHPRRGKLVDVTRTLVHRLA